MPNLRHWATDVVRFEDCGRLMLYKQGLRGDTRLYKAAMAETPAAG